MDTPGPKHSPVVRPTLTEHRTGPHFSPRPLVGPSARIVRNSRGLGARVGIGTEKPATLGEVREVEPVCRRVCICLHRRCGTNREASRDSGESVPGWDSSDQVPGDPEDYTGHPVLTRPSDDPTGTPPTPFGPEVGVTGFPTPTEPG